MPDHRVAVGTLSTELLAGLARGSDMERLGRALDEGLRSTLPRALGPVLDRHSGIIRLEHLHVDLDAVTAEDPAFLARELADAIARALSEALHADRAAPVRWPDRESYLAYYLVLRLGLASGELWPFADLAPLEQLSGPQAAVELLAACPEVLPLVASLGGLRDAAGWLGSTLDADSCRQLAAALCRQLGDRQAHWPPAQLLRGLPGLRTIPFAVPAVNLLAVLAESLAALPPDQRSAQWPRCFNAASALVALRLLLEAGGLGPGHCEPAAVRAALGRSGDLLPPIYRRSLAAALDQPGFDEVVQVEVRAGRRRSAGARGAAAPSAPVETSSAVAGAVLLLPGMLHLGVARLLDRQQLRDAALAALWGADAPDPQPADPLLDLIFPAGDSTEPDVAPPVPESLLAMVDDRSRHLLESADDGYSWSSLLLAAFAGALPGLRHSSPAYLRRQFLQVPGTLVLTESEVRITLQGPDLAIVLDMGGLSGSLGTVDWLGGRELRIMLGGGKP